jgi:hypothetical protein
MHSNLARFIDLAKELGAHDAKIIDARTIKTAAWVRMKCRYGCKYKKVHCCPPNTPTPQETQEIIDCYEVAMLIQTGYLTGIIIHHTPGLFDLSPFFLKLRPCLLQLLFQLAAKSSETGG